MHCSNIVKIAVITIVGLTLAEPARAWNLHYLITDRAVAPWPDLSTTLAESVQVEPIESLISDCRTQLAAAADDYYDFLEANAARRFHRMHFDPEDGSREEFVHAFRMNPSSRFPLVNRVLPGKERVYPEVPYASILPPADQKAGHRMVFEDVTGQEVSALSVLRTFSDEPDWGMDSGLWAIPEYGFGPIPYGGEKTSAPFHMQFLHENWLMRVAAPEMQDGLTTQRIELFSRLSLMAFECGHGYWGWRFAAWALHYLQDLTQPYHAKAAPPADTLFVLKYMVSSHKKEIKDSMTRMMEQRHLSYEEVVGYALQSWYLNQNDASLARALAGGVWDAKLDNLIWQVTRVSSAHAEKLDRILSKQDAVAAGLKEAARDFALTGAATRSFLRMIIRSEH